MAITESAPAAARQRAPRGARSISQAFFTALDSIPEARRMEVGKAAQAAIRDKLKLLGRKTKAAAAAGRKVQRRNA